MRNLGLDLQEHAPEILRLWRKVIAEPPLRLPTDHDVGELPKVIYDLVEASILTPHDLKAHEHKVADAARHGERRRAADYPEQIIFEEFSALREAIRRYLETCDVPRWKRRDAVMRLDMAITVAELASVRGYHRASFEQIGKWEEQIPRLARSSPLLGLPEPE